MSGISGPKIITSGCVLALDAADKLSYPGSGTTWKDLSGNGNTGTLTNGPTFSGANGGCIVFDGVDDSVNLPLVSTSTTTITISIWFNLTTLPGNKSLIYNGVGSSDGYGLNMGAGGTASTLYVFFGNVSLDVVRAPNIQTNTWYNAVYTRTTTPSVLNSLYVNGVLLSTNTTLSPNTPTTSTTLSVSVASLNGKISIASMYNRTLSATEVLQNYNATKSRFGY